MNGGGGSVLRRSKPEKKPKGEVWAKEGLDPRRTKSVQKERDHLSSSKPNNQQRVLVEV